jgi:hypothetical protein
MGHYISSNQDRCLANEHIGTNLTWYLILPCHNIFELQDSMKSTSFSNIQYSIVTIGLQLSFLRLPIKVFVLTQETPISEILY